MVGLINPTNIVTGNNSNRTPPVIINPLRGDADR